MKLINPEVRIENCSLCNSKCTICPREKMTRRKMIMDNDHFKYLVDQARSLGAKTISVFGYGEPLIDLGIVEKVRYCNELDLKTFITTNASLLDVNMTSALIKAGLHHVRFSVHGTGKQYEKVHRGLNYDKVMRNIMNFKSIARGRCKLSVSVIPMGGEDIQTLKKLYKGFDLEVWSPHNWTDGRQYRKLTKNRKKTCGRPMNGPIQILADGQMVVCCFDFDGKLVVGDTRKSTIEEILKCGVYNKIRHLHEIGDLGGLLCNTCDQLNIGDNPLLYSTIDPSCQAGRTSSTKFNLEEKNDVHAGKKRDNADSCGAGSSECLC